MKKPIKACFTNPHEIFNPGTAPAEEEDLAKFTNMANTEVFDGKADGPDIHPTPLGYEEMAKRMAASTCKP